MKGYIKLQLILEVESGDLEETFQVEDWILDEFEGLQVHKDIKIVDKKIDALQFEDGIEEGFDDLL